MTASAEVNLLSLYGATALSVVFADADQHCCNFSEIYAYRWVSTNNRWMTK